MTVENPSHAFAPHPPLLKTINKCLFLRQAVCVKDQLKTSVKLLLMTVLAPSPECLPVLIPPQGDQASNLSLHRETGVGEGVGVLVGAGVGVLIGVEVGVLVGVGVGVLVLVGMGVGVGVEVGVHCQ